MTVSPGAGVSAAILQVAVYRGANPPATAKVGDLWFDTVAGLWKYCVSVGPVVFATIDTGGGGSATPTSAQFVTLVDRVSANSATLTGEIAARIAGDDALSNAISSETAARIAADNALSNAISAEAAARSAADAALSNSISAEAAARSAADAALSNAISNEASARIAADNALSNSISAEAATRSAADAALSNAISNEASVRAAADLVLSNAISNEASVRAAADAALSNSISGLTPSGTGIMVRLGASSTSARTIVGNANEISVGAGDGIAGNPTLGIPTTFIAPGTVQATGSFIAGTSAESYTGVTGVNLNMLPGAAPTAGSTGVSMTIRGGPGGTTSGTGGALSLQGGTPTDGTGGGVTISGVPGVGTNRGGGSISLTAGAPTGTGALAGTVQIQGGGAAAASTGGGGIFISAGPGGGIFGGGTLDARAGRGGVSGPGGNAVLAGGNSQGPAAAGNASVIGGSAEGAGLGGDVNLRPGGSSAGAAGVLRITTGGVERVVIAGAGDWRVGGVSSQPGQYIRGGGPSAPPTWAFGAADVRVLAGDQTVLATALVDVSGQAFPVTAGQTYAFRFTIIFRSASTAFGPGFSLAFPAATAFAATVRIKAGPDGTAGEFEGAITASNDRVQSLSTETANTDFLAEIAGVIVASATGSVQLRAGNEVSAGAAGTSGIVIRRGTAALMWRVA